jgi:molecular chaperone GrpE
MRDDTPRARSAPGAGDSGGQIAAETAAAAERMAALEAEVASLKDRNLRTLAEMENLRKRTERETADARQYAVASFARDMLTVADNLTRAIAAVPAEARANDPALATLIEGVEVTERGMEQTLKKFGVRPVEAAGQKFDPAFHQAMYEVANSELPAGTVVEVIQPGYRIGDRVLRPALVAISKGGPAAPASGNGAPKAEPAGNQPG